MYLTINSCIFENYVGKYHTHNFTININLFPKIYFFMYFNLFRLLQNNIIRQFYYFNNNRILVINLHYKQH